jgi:pyridoxine 5-phosphate synthase
MPDVVKAAADCQRFGAHGITVHPRPDQRHIRYADLPQIAATISTEFNIEGYPSAQFMDMVLQVKPTQVTLVPDAADAITSNAGWDVVKNQEFLHSIVKKLHDAGIRASIFVEADAKIMLYAAGTGADRIELYTEKYARNYGNNAQQAIAPFVEAAQAAVQAGLQINAGHDLNLENLRYFAENVPMLSEVSIGHALVCDALYFGLENTIQMYLKQLSFNV